MLAAKSLWLLSVGLVFINAYVYHVVFFMNIRIRTIPAGKERVTLLEFPNRQTVLVGAGTDGSILRTLGEALPPWQRDISVLIIPTSSAGDSGLPLVLERYRVHLLVEPATQKPDQKTRDKNENARATQTAEVPPGWRVTMRYGSFSLDLSSSTPF